MKGSRSVFTAAGADAIAGAGTGADGRAATSEIVGVRAGTGAGDFAGNGYVTFCCTIVAISAFS